MKGLRLALFVASLAFASHAFGLEPAGVAATTGTIEYAFTPGNDAAGLIVRTIDAASTQVLVQAFSFTHRDIADALIRAHRRGLDVQVIADREQSDSLESTAMQSLIDAGVPLLLDAEHSAAHNKVVIIDSGTRQPVLITGSFNFTFAAQYRNAENVLVLRGNPELAQAFFENWIRHREHSVVSGRKHSR
ncbi:MAG: phospholipase D family protein [Betaproteobacteria bacterium]|jgi:phosphatidylserine/phosphatidylglycerophosphate/cardiolipin synthase-like enzyme